MFSSRKVQVDSPTRPLLSKEVRRTRCSPVSDRRRWKLCMWISLGLLLVAELLVLFVGYFGWRQGVDKLAAVGLCAALIGLPLFCLIHRRSQFTLKTLLVVVAVFCVWLGITAKRTHEQGQAVEAILEMGGKIIYEYALIHPNDYSGPLSLRWLRQLVGDEYFVSIRSVTLHGPKVNDASLPAITQLRDVKLLELGGTQITDAGLLHLKGLTKLRVLDASDTSITSTGLMHLKGLSNLHQLFLSSTQITDAGLENLGALTNLRELRLDATKVTDVGLEHLKGLTELQVLNLNSTKVTDVGLVHIKGLSKLRTLWLSNTQVTDEGVKELRQALPNCKICYFPLAL